MVRIYGLLSTTIFAARLNVDQYVHRKLRCSLHLMSYIHLEPPKLEYLHLSNVPSENSRMALTGWSEPFGSIVVIRVKFFQTELMVEICSKSVVRAIGKVLLMKFS